MLAEDPGAEVFLQVGRELLDRGLWQEAADVLAAGLETGGGAPEAWALLARAAHESGQHLQALAALGHCETDPTGHEELARLRVLALEATGDLGRARAAAEDFLRVHPDDVVVTSVLERLESPPPDRRRRLADPLISVVRAEQYLDLGRTDRAIRVYRRLVQHFPSDPSLQHRLRELHGQPVHAPADDLSEELTAREDEEWGTPPGLTMPSPGSGLRGANEGPTEPSWDEENTEIDGAPPDFVYGEGVDEREADEEPTVRVPEEDLHGDDGARGARRRRSLIRK